MDWIIQLIAFVVIGYVINLLTTPFRRQERNPRPYHGAPAGNPHPGTGMDMGGDYSGQPGNDPRHSPHHTGEGTGTYLDSGDRGRLERVPLQMTSLSEPEFGERPSLDSAPPIRNTWTGDHRQQRGHTPYASTSTPLISRDHALQGMIWAEIFGKPRSLSPHRSRRASRVSVSPKDKV